ncbi:MAG: hypothetical protein UY07_C0006G0020 [Parcubacteria group bacterium GW2011_GWA1_47_8]|nr:MAG: hypothetical protein UY07_C0006G0020 [Parcubacteria group bacterium GW2011_GWA1_47_8]
MDYTEEQISLAFDKLPRSTQDILFTPEIEQAVQSVLASQQLPPEGKEFLNALTNMALLKIADEEEFSKKLMDQMKIDDATAKKITSAVFSEIITPTRMEEKREAESLESSLEENDGEKPSPSATENATPPTAPPSETPKPKPSPEEGLPAVPSAEEGLPPFGMKIPSVPIPPRPPVIRPIETPQIAVPLPPSPPPQTTTPQTPVVPPAPAELHPFEQQMKKVLTSTPTPAPQEIPTTPRYGVPETPVAPPVPSPAPAPTAPTPPGHDPYREAVE